LEEDLQKKAVFPLDKRGEERKSARFPTLGKGGEEGRKGLFRRSIAKDNATALLNRRWRERLLYFFEKAGGKRGKEGVGGETFPR